MSISGNSDRVVLPCRALSNLAMFALMLAAYLYTYAALTIETAFAELALKQWRALCVCFCFLGGNLLPNSGFRFAEKTYWAQVVHPCSRFDHGEIRALVLDC
jgi:hypothetical protein